DGVSTERGLMQSWPKGGPELLWNAKDTNKADKSKSVGTGWSSLAIVGKRIFTLGDFAKECHLVCLDRDNGKVLWSTKIGGSRAGDGPRSTPTVEGDRVYGLSNAGQLACLNVETGDIVWKKDYTLDFKGKSMAAWHFCESVLIDGDRVVCTPGGDE